MLHILFFALSTFAHQPQSQVLLEVSRSTNEGYEKFILSADGPREYITVTSNRLNLNKKETGTYSRNATPLKGRLYSLEKIYRKNGHRAVASATQDWQVRIMGTLIDSSHPHHSEMIKLIKENFNHKSWKREKVISVIQNGPRLIVSKIEGKSLPTRYQMEFDKACGKTLDGYVVCHIDQNIVFMN